MSENVVRMTSLSVALSRHRLETEAVSIEPNLKSFTHLGFDSASNKDGDAQRATKIIIHKEPPQIKKGRERN